MSGAWVEGSLERLREVEGVEGVEGVEVWFREVEGSLERLSLPAEGRGS
jgi:hypothetical protein